MLYILGVLNYTGVYWLGLLLSNQEYQTCRTIIITGAAYSYHLMNILFNSWNCYVECGHAVVQWLKHCATNRKVVELIPEGVIVIFH
jgi:hypothetical protein